MELKTEFVKFLIEGGKVAVPEQALWDEFERRSAEKKKLRARAYNRRYYQKKKEAEKGTKTDVSSS